MTVPPDQWPDDLSSAEAGEWFPLHLMHTAHDFFTKFGEVKPMALVIAKRDPKTRLTLPKPRVIPTLIVDLANENDKAAVAHALLRLADRAEAYGIGLMIEAWTLRRGMREDEYRSYVSGSLGRHPERAEVVNVSWQHRAGGRGLRMAEIIREPGCKPVLGPWVPSLYDFPAGVEVDLSGRFVDLLPKGDG